MCKFTHIAFKELSRWPVQPMEITVSPKIAVKNLNLSLFWSKFSLRWMSVLVAITILLSLETLTLPFILKKSH